MLRQFHNQLGEPAARAMRGRTRGLVRIFFYGLYTLSTTCDAATLAPQTSLASESARYPRLSEVWKEAFPPVSDELAPSSLAHSFPPSEPTAPWAGVQRRSDRPHPAVARIVVPEGGATSYGSGTLIDVRENFGLVITNWHVVRDASGTIEVIFPNGFTSKARALKVDANWDLAALVVWRPEEIEAVPIAEQAPRPGDQLTICGYGQGNYRCATGRCTQYYAPRSDFPRHMVELDVEARQGDSGGPIFNERGELAGVLFGSGQGTTLGSFGGRVGAFLATLAPDIGRAEEALARNAPTIQPAADEHRDEQFAGLAATPRQASLSPHQHDSVATEVAADQPPDHAMADWPMESGNEAPSDAAAEPLQVASLSSAASSQWQAKGPRSSPFEQIKTALAVVGFVTIVVQVLRVAQ